MLLQTSERIGNGEFAVTSTRYARKPREGQRRSFDEATICMAFVICAVFFTDLMRRRMSRVLGIANFLFPTWHPGGMPENSPTFQRWGNELSETEESRRDG